ncbi:hypothetical protein SAMN05216474_2688 [Lishizhenia tianjinensis]|uniref:Uncharacterized protein n=1 Tax=Lishizhenia tianjinensis TaxID=477690 RepID=A0A1I7BCV0_9FLAO|nr:hypothetical protein [Lishizhenia tianjinensis]SFT85023.1 hypothetical protein SAMN05216474_2688 [Lishizhenia tianjinensis]
MVLLGIIIGYFVGKILIGGILFTFLTKADEDPNGSSGKFFEYFGGLIGAISLGFLFNEF